MYVSILCYLWKVKPRVSCILYICARLILPNSKSAGKRLSPLSIIRFLLPIVTDLLESRTLTPSSVEICFFVYLFIPLIFIVYLQRVGLPVGASGKEPICQRRRCKRHEFDPWVGKMPWQPSSILVWRILWTEEAGGLQSLGLQKS